MSKFNVFRLAVLLSVFAVIASPPGRLRALAPLVPTPTGPVVVTSGNLQGWLLFNDGTTTPATAGFVTGPGTPPLGIGSYGTAITTGNSKIVFGRTDAGYNGVPLSSIVSFSYSTYVDPTSTSTLNWYASIYLDSTGTGTTYDYRLDFTPPGTTKGVWQTWDAMTQPYWQLVKHSPLSFGAPGTLATVTAGLPGTTRIIQGFTTTPQYPSIKFTMGDSASDYVGFVGNIDNITIGVGTIPPVTYDLDIPPPNTATPTATATNTATNTFTATPTDTSTATATITPSNTASVTASVTNTPTNRPTGTLPNTVTNTATATGTLATVFPTVRPTTPPTSPPSGPTATPNVQIADPQIAKTVDVLLAQPGSPVNFTLTVTNIGTVTAPNVQVIDPLPTPLVFGSATASQGTFSVSGNTVRFAVGNVAPGQVITLTIHTTVSPNAQPPIDLTNNASLADSQGHSSSASATVRITSGGLPATGEIPPANPISRLGIGLGVLALIGIGVGFGLKRRGVV